MMVNVLFFGVLSEVTGTRLKVYSDVPDINNLRNRITDDFPELMHYIYRIALNNELTEENSMLKDGDEIAFLPPFAGG
jgi:molybdopterin converting factor small subunit